MLGHARRLSDQLFHRHKPPKSVRGEQPISDSSLPHLLPPITILNDHERPRNDSRPRHDHPVSPSHLRSSMTRTPSPSPRPRLADRTNLATPPPSTSAPQRALYSPITPASPAKSSVVHSADLSLPGATGTDHDHDGIPRSQGHPSTRRPSLSVQAQAKAHSRPSLTPSRTPDVIQRSRNRSGWDGSRSTTPLSFTFASSVMSASPQPSMKYCGTTTSPTPHGLKGSRSLFRHYSKNGSTSSLGQVSLRSLASTWSRRRSLPRSGGDSMISSTASGIGGGMGSDVASSYGTSAGNKTKESLSWPALRAELEGFLAQGQVIDRCFSQVEFESDVQGQQLKCQWEDQLWILAQSLSPPIPAVLISHSATGLLVLLPPLRNCLYSLSLLLPTPYNLITSIEQLEPLLNAIRHTLQISRALEKVIETVARLGLIKFELVIPNSNLKHQQDENENEHLLSRWNGEVRGRTGSGQRWRGRVKL